MTHPPRPPWPEDVAEVVTDVAVLVRHPEFGWIIQHGRAAVRMGMTRDELVEPWWGAVFGSAGMDSGSWGPPRYLTGVEWRRKKDAPEEPLCTMRWWDGPAPLPPFDRIEPGEQRR